MKKRMMLLVLCAGLMAGCGANNAAVPDTKTNESAWSQSEEAESETAASNESVFSKFKEDAIELSKDIEFNDSNFLLVLNDFKNSYYPVYNLESIVEANGGDDLSKFTVCASFLMLNFENGTIAHDAGEKSWEAIESLWLGKDDFKDKMDEVKYIFEMSGEYLFENKYDEGQYKVGSDIPAGEYVIFANDSSGYFALTSDANGNDIITNENFSYNSIIIAEDGEYLELSRSYAVPIDEVDEISKQKGTMFKVGTHLDAGEYKLISDKDSGYYCIYSDGRQDDIVSNGGFSGQSYVNVSDGQYLRLSRCHIEMAEDDSNTAESETEVQSDAGSLVKREEVDLGEDDILTVALFEKDGNKSLNVSADVSSPGKAAWVFTCLLAEVMTSDYDMSVSVSSSLGDVFSVAGQIMGTDGETATLSAPQWYLDYSENTGISDDEAKKLMGVINEALNNFEEV